MRNKLICFLYFYSTLLYIIFPVCMVLQSRQNMNKSMYLGTFHYNKILFQNKFLFLFCPILPSEQIVRKYIFIFSHPLKFFQNSSVLNKV
jgi:hypothetical protein